MQKSTSVRIFFFHGHQGGQWSISAGKDFDLKAEMEQNIMSSSLLPADDELTGSTWKIRKMVELTVDLLPHSLSVFTVFTA